MIASRLRFLFVSVVLVASLCAETVTVRQGTLTVATYDEGPPDPNPVFAALQPEGPFYYPYATRKNFTKNQSRKTWRTLELENEYLRCTILPDLGGRVYSCVDKVARRDLFYGNSVFKKADIGQRGAWVAAGTEFNFPVGHSWTTVSPVDFATRRNADGSASVWVGDTDRVRGLRWVVEIVLRPGVSVLEERVTLSNPGAIRQPYYWWNNAGVPAYDDTRFILPCRATVTHGQEDPEPWPIGRNGVDNSMMASHKAEGYARFALGCKEDFLGVYSAREGYGTVHFAEAGTVPGKKVWTWGSGEVGRKAAEQYTDDGAQYVEVQAGLFPDQETFGFLNPGEARRFEEYWMPVRGLGGVSRVNRAGAVYLEREGNELRVKLQVYQALAGARLVVSHSDETDLSETVGLDPTRVETRVVKGLKAGAVYRFELRDAQGAVRLAHTEGLYDALPVMPRAAAKAVDLGGQAEMWGDLVGAAGRLKEPLALGRVLLALNRFGEAARVLGSVPAMSAEHHYYLGLAWARLGDERKAKAEWDLIRHDVFFRRVGHRENDPADSLARLEAGRDEAFWRHLAADPERVLSAATFYMNAGKYREALALLDRKYLEVGALEREPGMVLPQDYPLVGYYAGYCRQKLGGDGAADFARASKQSTQYVFPNRAETFAVLSEALRSNPNDATAHYLLGALHLAGGSADAAAGEWQAAVKLNSEAVGLHASLGKLLRDVKKDSASAGKVFQEGLRVDPLNRAVQDGVQQELQRKQAALEAANGRGLFSDKVPPPDKPEAIAELVLNMLAAGRIDAAAGLFTEANFPKDRQGELVKWAFIETRVRAALALAGGKKCETALAVVAGVGEEAAGVPFTLYGFAGTLKSARTQYLLGSVEAACGEEKAARKRWAKAAKAGGTGVDGAYARVAEAAASGDRERVQIAAAEAAKAVGDGKDAVSAYLRAIGGG